MAGREGVEDLTVMGSMGVHDVARALTERDGQRVETPLCVHGQVGLHKLPRSGAGRKCCTITSSPTNSRAVTGPAFSPAALPSHDMNTRS